MLNGVNVTNNIVLVTNISEGGFGVTGMDDGGLLCITNRSECCRASDNPNGFGLGEWYFPNGNPVEIRGNRQYGDSFFYRNRDARLVRLNRVGNPPERGLFHCEIPNAYGYIVSLYVNIGEYHQHKLWIMITGTNYTLSISSGPATSYIYTSTLRASYGYYQY